MIKYLNGDVFDFFEYDEYVIVPHVANDLYIWGSGFVVALMNRWPDIDMVHESKKMKLGQTEFQNVEGNTVIASMIAQRGFPTRTQPQALSIPHLRTCMEEVYKFWAEQKAKGIEYKIMSPKFGALRSGGSWEEIEKIINELWSEIDVTVFVYEEK